MVEATLKVVAEHGVTRATFDEIGKGAGLSRGLATQRFGSKHGLIAAVIAHLHRKREAIMGAEHIDQMPSIEAVAHYVDGHLRGLETGNDGPAYFMLLASTVADATAVGELFAASHERVRIRLRGLLARGQANGEIVRDLDPDAIALTIGSLLLGASMQRLVDSSTDLESIRDAVVTILRRALALPERREMRRLGRKRHPLSRRVERKPRG